MKLHVGDDSKNLNRGNHISCSRQSSSYLLFPSKTFLYAILLLRYLLLIFDHRNSQGQDNHGQDNHDENNQGQDNYNQNSQGQDNDDQEDQDQEWLGMSWVGHLHCLSFSNSIVYPSTNERKQT